MGASNLFLMRLALIITKKIYIIGLPINILICHLMVFVIIFKLRIFCKIAYLDNNCIIMSNFKHQFTQITCKQNYTKVFRIKEFLLFCSVYTATCKFCWFICKIYRQNVLRVRLNRSWFTIHDEVLNFHKKIFCFHEPFHDKIKK